MVGISDRLYESVSPKTKSKRQCLHLKKGKCLYPDDRLSVGPVTSRQRAYPLREKLLAMCLGGPTLSLTLPYLPPLIDCIFFSSPFFTCSFLPPISHGRLLLLPSAMVFSPSSSLVARRASAHGCTLPTLLLQRRHRTMELQPTTAGAGEDGDRCCDRHQTILERGVVPTTASQGCFNWHGKKIQPA